MTEDKRENRAAERKTLPPKFSPSMMCAGITHLSEVLSVFADCGIHSLHIDVMDGSFVPNFTLGTDYCRRLRALTNIPLDLHLMITKPEDKLDWFDIQPGEYVSVHAESTVHLHRALCRIRDHGAHPIAALNPATPLSTLDYILDEADGVLLMTVNPGFAGQPLVPGMVRKIADCRAYLDSRGYPNHLLQVDGCVSFAHIAELCAAGADYFVTGSSSVFHDSDSGENAERIRENCRRLTEILEEQAILHENPLKDV